MTATMISVILEKTAMKATVMITVRRTGGCKVALLREQQRMFMFKVERYGGKVCARRKAVFHGDTCCKILKPWVAPRKRSNDNLGLFGAVGFFLLRRPFLTATPAFA